MPDCGVENSADKRGMLFVWDAEGVPPTGDWTTVLWSAYANVKDATVISVPELVELHAGELKARYLAWIHDLGVSTVAGMRVVDHLAIRPGFSYWWMSSLAQKFNVSGVSQIDDAIKALALERLVVARQATSIVLVSGNPRLAVCVQDFCRKSGINYEFRQARAIQEKRNYRSLYQLLPHACRALIYLAWYVFKAIPLLLQKRPATPTSVGEVTFIDVLVHLDKQEMSAGRFVSNYWTSLVGKLSEWGIASCWLHIFFRHPAIPTLVQAQRQIDRFNAASNSSQFHALIERSLNFRMLFTALGDYFTLNRSFARLLGVGAIRPVSSELNLWPLHAEEWADSICGREAMRNCLRVALFERAIGRLPPQRLGIYICENQSWEMALVHAWRSAGHGILVGVPHTTVRFWDLRYHYDARSYLRDNDNGLPLPDIWAVNGPATRESVLASGYPPDRVTEVEALRFLHLLKPRQGRITSHKPRPELHVLVCGDFLAETNRRILSWLENAAKSLPRETVYVFKPHPAYPLNSSDYSTLNLEMSEAPLAVLLAGCDVVFTSNITSAAVDAYCSGIPVIQMLDGSTFNVSPLRGMEGAVYVSNPKELAEALGQAMGKAKGCNRIVAAPYFCLDEALPRWRKLLGLRHSRDEVGKPYVATDLAFVVPTKDRHAQLERLLESLARQTQTCGRIVVVDGGTSAERVVSGFQGRLAVDYIHCPVPGQIRQRNLGIEALGTRYRLVGFLDDDLVLESDALEKMIEFWNRAEEGTAGVGFNITNVEPLRHSPLLCLFFMSVNTPGKVLKSGYNVGFANIPSDIRVQWLGGGYTVWRSSILQQFPQETLNTRWAIGEDLRFSYPIGKKYPLYVCADARVRHEHVFDQGPPKKIHLYRGRKSVVSQFYFAKLHAGDFSRIACLWMLLGKCIFRFTRACLKADGQSVLQAIGEVDGLLVCFRSALTSKDLRMEMED